MTPTGYFLEHLWLIPLFPLATASLMLLVGRRLRKSAVSLFCVGSVGVSFAYALGAVTQLLSAPPENRVVQHILFEWLAPGQMLLSSGQVVPFTADWGYLLDPLSSVMVLVVTGVGFLIHVYSIGYMRSEEHTSELQSRLHLVCRLLLEKKQMMFLAARIRTLQASAGSADA